MLKQTKKHFWTDIKWSFLQMKTILRLILFMKLLFWYPVGSDVRTIDNRKCRFGKFCKLFCSESANLPPKAVLFHAKTDHNTSLSWYQVIIFANEDDITLNFNYVATLPIRMCTRPSFHSASRQICWFLKSIAKSELIWIDEVNQCTRFILIRLFHKPLTDKGVRIGECKFCWHTDHLRHVERVKVSQQTRRARCVSTESSALRSVSKSKAIKLYINRKGKERSFKLCKSGFDQIVQSAVRSEGNQTKSRQSSSWKTRAQLTLTATLFRPMESAELPLQAGQISIHSTWAPRSGREMSTVRKQNAFWASRSANFRSGEIGILRFGDSLCNTLIHTPLTQETNKNILLKEKRTIFILV